MKTAEQERAERRAKNFQCVIEPDNDGEIYLLITRDGHQWQGVNLNHSEMIKVIKVLQEELAKPQILSAEKNIELMRGADEEGID